MFERDVYNSVPAEPVKEGDFLFDYEITGWQISKRIYPILGVSVLANILALVIFASTPVLTARGCDGPLVNHVCEVLDTVYLGTALLGTNRQWVDEAYTKTDLGDADITFIDVSGDNAPLEYPEGYFQLANPEQFTAQDQASLNSGFLAPGIPITPPQTSPGLINTPQVLPTPNAGAVDESLLPKGIDDGTSAGSTATSTKKGRGGRLPRVPGNSSVAGVTSNPTASPSPQASPTIPPGAPTETDALNAKPFKDLAAKVIDLQAKKTLDLQAPLDLTATAKLNNDGKIAEGSFKFGKIQSSNAELVDVAKDAVAAFNDSNLLKYLQAIGGAQLNFALHQDQTNITAGITSDLQTESKAKAAVSLLKFALQTVRDKKTKEIADLQGQIAAAKTPEEATQLQSQLQNVQDDLSLLNAAVVDNKGKVLNINFSSQKDILHQMIQRKLDEQAAQILKENGNATATPNQNNAIK